MKKNTKMIIGISSVVAVLGITLAVILLMPSDESRTETPTQDIILINKASLNADDITVKNQSGEYQILGYDYSETLESADTDDVPLIYTMQGYEHTLLSKLMTDNLVNECRTVAATRIVDRSGKKYIDYGLDKPRAEVRVIYSDSSKAEMFFGNEAPDKSGTYCRIDGDKNVYLVNSGSIDMFFMDKLQLFNKTLTGEMSETENISGIEISDGGSEPVTVTDQQNDTMDAVYIMTSPYTELCDRTKTVDFATGFFDMKMSAVAAAEVTEDDIKKFGLAEPYMDIKITTTETKINILVSEKDDDGNFYIMSKGSNIIYQTDEDEFKYYGAGYRDFLSESIFSPKMPNVTAAKIEYEDKSYEYTLERQKVINDLYEESLNTVMYYNGETVNYGNLLNFTESLSNIRRTWEMSENTDGFEEMFRITLQFEKENYSLVLYQNDQKEILAEVDGIKKCIVDTDFVNKILAQTEKIPTEEPVAVVEQEEE